MAETEHGATRAGLPEGFLDVFSVASLPSTHPAAIVERGGKAIHATEQQGFLCFGQYKKGYPTMPLKAFFSIQIDRNAGDDRNILILDVYDHHQDRVIGNRLLTRKDFPSANAFCLFEFDFTPPSAEANMEFRAYYMGAASVLADKIAIVDPAKRTIAGVQDLPPVAVKPPEPDKQTPPAPEYCQGNELLCAPSVTAETISKAGGRLIGGAFLADGQFTPTLTGGLEFPLTLDASRPYVVEMDIEGNIPNWHLGEENGGKVSLFTIQEERGFYYVSLQRMDGAYRSGGRFRLFITDRRNACEEGAGWLITIPDLSGEYHMRDWGNEPHHIEAIMRENRCQLKIDRYVSTWAIAPFAIGGQRSVKLIIGNREPNYLFLEEAALTRFKRFKVMYI